MLRRSRWFGRRTRDVVSPRRRRNAQTRLGEFGPVSLAELKAQLPETPFQRGVVQQARMLGWRVLAVRPVRIERKGRDGESQIRYETPFGGDGKGWPDLTLVREVPLFRELKSGTGRMRPEQDEWKDALIAAGASWAIWTPADSDEIDRSLSHRWRRGYPPRLIPCGNRFCCPEPKGENE